MTELIVVLVVAAVLAAAILIWLRRGPMRRVDPNERSPQLGMSTRTSCWSTS
jgi:hypothetical protein